MSENVNCRRTSGLWHSEDDDPDGNDDDTIMRTIVMMVTIIINDDGDNDNNNNDTDLSIYLLFRMSIVQLSVSSIFNGGMCFKY